MGSYSHFLDHKRTTQTTKVKHPVIPRKLKVIQVKSALIS